MAEKMNAIMKTIEAPDYPVTCDNCHEVGTNKSMTEHVCPSIEPSPSRMMAERIVRAYAPKSGEKLIGAIDAALQAEREAVYSSWIEVGCGCRIEYGYALRECPQDRILFCPLHANAEKLREVLKDLRGFLNVTPLHLNDGDSITLSMLTDRARAVLDEKQ